MPVHEIESLRLKRAAAFEEMKELNEKALNEERDLSAEEREKFDKIEGDFDSLTAQIERSEKLEGIAPQMTRSQVTPPSEPADIEEKREIPESIREFRAEQLGGRVVDSSEYRAAFYNWLTTRDLGEVDASEMRTLSKASAGAGLNLVPTSFQRTLIDALRDYGVIRQIATVINTDSGETIQVPTVSSHGTASWVAENGAYSASDDAFGQSSLSAYKAGTLIQVSEELLQDAAFDLDSYIANEFGQRIGVLENTGYVVGDGSGKPTGVSTQASAGVTAAGAAAITANELIDLYHSLLPPYRARASWVFKDSTIKLVRKLADTTNQYLWQPGLQAGAPDTLLGKPVYADPDMPAATTGLVSVLFGDFSYYWIRDAGNIAFQRLNELYAANGQIGFRAYHRTDGKLLNTAAVKKLTQA